MGDFIPEIPIIKKWGPEGYEFDFLRQTMNCLHGCEMSMVCNKSAQCKDLQDNWIKIVKPRNKNPSLDLEFMFTPDHNINAKNMQKEKMMSQKFWMFRAVNWKEIYVVFTCQETSAYILSDAAIWRSPNQKDIANVDNIPISFFKALLQKDYHVIFTGHSLGGALAILTTCRLAMKDLSQEEVKKIRCITFGAPQIPYHTQEEYMREFDEIIYRYELSKDPVPQLLTAFQNAHNPNQQFLANVFNLLGIQNSFKFTPEVQLGLRDSLKMSEGVLDEIIKQSGFGTTLIPKTRKHLQVNEFYIDHNPDWSRIQNVEKIQLSEILEDLKSQHHFQRYKEEIMVDRINKLNLPKSRDEIVDEVVKMKNFRIPNPNLWSNQVASKFGDHPNQIWAYFDERFTQIVIASKFPHALSIRYAEIQEFRKWGKEAVQILQDRNLFRVKFVFFSQKEYSKLQSLSTLNVTLHGCFESVKDINVSLKKSSGTDVLQLRNPAYKDVHLQLLYSSAFQASLFAGEGHNPMLQGQNLEENKRKSLLEEDHKFLVEVLGSMIVNQHLLSIIDKENWREFQNFKLHRQTFKDCDKKILKELEDMEKAEKQNHETKKLIEEAQAKLQMPYHKFEFGSLKNQDQEDKEVLDAKKCVEEAKSVTFSLATVLVWQMKMYFYKNGIWGTLTKGTSGAVSGLTGAAGYAIAAEEGISLLIGRIIVGASVGVIYGAAAFAFMGIISQLVSVIRTSFQFSGFFKSYETMKIQYREQLNTLVESFGYESGEQLTISELEQKIVTLCQNLLQQEQIGYNYEQSEEEINKVLLELLVKNNPGSNQVQGDLETTQQNKLQELIDRKVNILGNGKIFEKYQKSIKIPASRKLAALLIFVWNNFRIRLCLSKTWRIGVMGQKNAGKSTFSKLLGCPIESIGQNHATKDATLYQNVPANYFSVVDFTHLDNVELNDTMKLFYSLSDITVIIMKSQDEASKGKENEEVGEIIKTMQEKYSSLGYGNQTRKLPILMLFNQVDAMVFNEDGRDPDEQHLKNKFQNSKKEIKSYLNKTIGFEEEKVYFLYTALQPTLPKKQASQQEILLWAQQLQEKEISAQEFVQRTQVIVDKKKLHAITGCSFFDKEDGIDQNGKSIVQTLVQMVEHLGDEEGAESLKTKWKDNFFPEIILKFDYFPVPQ